MIFVLSSDLNYNRIILNDISVDFGIDVIIECRYGIGFRNLFLYCGESGVVIYILLGDNFICLGLELNFFYYNRNVLFCIWVK